MGHLAPGFGLDPQYSVPVPIEGLVAHYLWPHAGTAIQLP